MSHDRHGRLIARIAWLIRHSDQDSQAHQDASEIARRLAAANVPTMACTTRSVPEDGTVED